MISHQHDSKFVHNNADSPAEFVEDILIGARILRFAVALDSLRIMGLTQQEAITRLLARRSEFEKEMVEALTDIQPETASGGLRNTRAAWESLRYDHPFRDKWVAKRWDESLEFSEAAL
jgi:hypothetical protein